MSLATSQVASQPCPSSSRPTSLLDLGKPAGERALGTEVSLTPAPFASRLKQDGRVCFLDRLGRINVSGHAFLGEDRVDLFPNLGVELPPHGGDVFL